MLKKTSTSEYLLIILNMATFLVALIWWWVGEMQQMPTPAINLQGGQSQRQILPQAPRLNVVAMTLFMVQCFFVVVLFTTWGLWKTRKKLYRYCRNLLFLIRGRFRGVDIAGDFVNERMSGSDRNGYAASRLWTTRTNENTRAPLLPVFLSIYRVNHDEVEAGTASNLGSNQPISASRESTTQLNLGDQKADEEIQWVIEHIRKHGDEIIKTNSRNRNEYIRKYGDLKIRDENLYFSPVNKRGRILIRFEVPVNSREAVIEKLHSSVFSGHLGVAKTIERANERIWWPFYQVDITEISKACESCQMIKRGVVKPFRPVHLMTMDDAGPSANTRRGNVYIQLIIHNFTKLLRAYSKAVSTAKTVAKMARDERKQKRGCKQIKRVKEKLSAMIEMRAITRSGRVSKKPFISIQ